MTVEVYVSLNGLDYERLDLMKSESINMKYVYKDTQDLSKIYSPYSQSFALQGSLNNQKILGFLGETKILKTKTNNNFDCKIYTNGLLAKKGLLKVTEARYEKGKIKSFTANFTTGLLSLKDRMGEDKVGDLGKAIIDWTTSNVRNYLEEGLIYGTEVEPYLPYVFMLPFISNYRVWQVADINNPTNLDNIAYNPNADKNGDNFIKVNELAPALLFRTIIDLIKSKYELDIVMPLESEDFYNDLYVYCNKIEGSFANDVYYDIMNPFQTIFYTYIPFDPYLITADFFNNEFKITKTNSNYSYGICYLDLNFYNVQNTKSNEDITIDVTLEVLGGTPIETKSITKPNGSEISTFDFNIPDTKFTLNEFKFKIKVKSNTPITWVSSTVELYYDFKTATRRIQKISTNNNSTSMGMSKIDLFKSLPDLKVIDFLTSFFKTFNISVFESAPDDGRLYWLTPKDIEAENKEYSKAEADYTDYVTDDKVNKKIANDYNYYNFKHKQGKYKGNVDYLRLKGYEYGQLVHPAIKPTKDLSEFKVDTNFTILESVNVNGLTNVTTSYGFTSDMPTVQPNNALRYKPNTEDFTVFFYNGRVAPSTKVGILNVYPNSFKIIEWIYSGVNSVSSIHNQSGFSLGFGLIETATTESLYENYYKLQTERLLEPNTLQSTFILELPPSELVLNYANTNQGESNIPSGFRLQNDIVIGETRYSILDATIDQTTGKTTLNLLNYV